MGLQFCTVGRTIIFCLQIYMVMFNEANVCNLLETILFNKSACEALGDAAIDLVDYVIRHLTLLCSRDAAAMMPSQGTTFKEDLRNWKPGQPLPDIPVESIDAELDRLRNEVIFQVVNLK